VYLVVSRPALERHDPLTLISWVFLLGTVEMAVVALPQLLDADWGAMTGVGWTAFAYVILCGSVVTYGLNTWVLRHATASRVASFVYLQPVVGAFLAWLVLGEPLGWRVFAAGGLILAGVALANQASRRSRRAANPPQ
ncbi:MAG TPA: DMT family transporter, partial [Candidatus Thermoplasmatota archaeon]|nr:DMT family transporter [Candidatus Thermoplasmatota archaeon]